MPSERSERGWERRRGANGGATPDRGSVARWESLAQNHAFIDGNRRTAFAATYTFLAINGARLTPDAEETYAFVDTLYKANLFRFDQLVPWLRSHVTQNL